MQEIDQSNALLNPMSPQRMTSANNNNKPKKQPLNLRSSLAITLFFIVVITIAALLLLHAPASLLLHAPASYICSNLRVNDRSWSGDLRRAEFSWNRLHFPDGAPPLATLKIAVFSRKWPTSSNPGGMERHAHTLHTALARRGHRVHIFTSPPANWAEALRPQEASPSAAVPILHFHEGEPEKWHYDRAWEQFKEENQREPFDVVHSESVALPFWLAVELTNLAVSWHGIALESVESSIYQDLIRKPDEPMSPAFSKSLEGVIPKVLNEIRFFSKYTHHIAISDSCGEMLRDVYQIPSQRVHVIVNGVNEEDFVQDSQLGQTFRNRIGVPTNASVVLGIAGRLVRDKGHPILFEAFTKLKQEYSNVYLIIAGSGPWESRYRELGSQVLVLGSMNPIQLRGFYNAIDVFVNPTLRPQGLDLTLMEAMMSGKPIMASRFPSIKRTLVVDDEFGFMFSPNVDSLYEAMETVVAEGAVRLSQRGAACKKYAATMFTARKMAMAYERLFLCIKNQTFCMYP